LPTPRPPWTMAKSGTKFTTRFSAASLEFQRSSPPTF
jgi:hypothetical protein